MSVEQAKAFIEKMKTDVAFRKRVLSIEDVDKRITFINKEGFICNMEEIKQVQRELKVEEFDTNARGCAPKCPARCAGKEVE